MKEYKNLTPIVEKYREYRKACASHEEAAELLDEGGLDKDFRELVEEQYRESQEKMEHRAEELKILLLPKDPNDDKNVIVEIRAGAGGEEAALFAAVAVSGCTPCTPSAACGGRWRAGQRDRAGRRQGESASRSTGEGAYSPPEV